MGVSPVAKLARSVSLALLLLLLWWWYGAQVRAAEFRPTGHSMSALLSTNTPLKRLAPGVFELGKVRLDKARKAVSFPAVVNMSDGLMEYLVVTQYGKTHESILRTDAEPLHIHVALLLLGAKGAGAGSPAQDATKQIAGTPVVLELTWKIRGKEHRQPIESIVYNRRTKSPMSKGTWTYNGSLLVEGSFVAQSEGSVVSLIADAGALVNNPRAGSEDDEAWGVNKDLLPPADQTLQVVIQLQDQ